MPVDSEHPSYKEFLPKWRKCRICVEGEEAVKAAGQAVVPYLSGQKQGEYDAYLMRASFFGATARTLEVVTGMIFRKDPQVLWPDSRKEVVEYVTADYRSLPTFAKAVVREVFTTGRYGVFVDMEQNKGGAPVTGARPYLCGHVAESIINWRTAMVDGRLQLVYVALHEMKEEKVDEFTVEYVEQIRILRLDVSDDTGNNVYRVELYRLQEGTAAATGTRATKGTKQSAAAAVRQVAKALGKKWMRTEEFTPTRAGLPLTFIPFIIIGANDLTADVDKPPMLDLANVNLSHFRNSADLEHGRHFVGLPTPYACGFKVARGDTLTLGVTRAWVTEEVGATAGFLEFQGAGLGALERGLTDKQKQMAILGARILEEDKLAAEAADTHKIRKSGENSAVGGVAGTVSQGLTQALAWLRDWLVISGDASIELNKEFFDTPIDSATLTTMMMMVQSGTMSWETFFFNLQKGGVYPPGHSLEDEFAFIQMGGPVSDLVVSDDPDEEGGGGDDDPGAGTKGEKKGKTGTQGDSRRNPKKRERPTERT